MKLKRLKVIFAWLTVLILTVTLLVIQRHDVRACVKTLYSLFNPSLGGRSQYTHVLIKNDTTTSQTSVDNTGVTSQELVTGSVAILLASIKEKGALSQSSAKAKNAHSQPLQKKTTSSPDSSQSFFQQVSRTETSVGSSRSANETWCMYPDEDWGGESISYVDLAEENKDEKNEEQYQTSDDWPKFAKKYFPGPVPRSPYKPKFAVKWGLNTSAFLQRPNVKDQPPKIIVWIVPPRNVPSLPEPVRLRICPEMPCRLTTSQSFFNQSAALLWNAEVMTSPRPPLRTNFDQVFVLHNNEPQTPFWPHLHSFRNQNWRHSFNWTWTYRNDSDLKAFYGYIMRRHSPLQKNYTAILARKAKLAMWMCSNCKTHNKREDVVNLLKQHMAVDVFGSCGSLTCAREKDDSCFEMFSATYKFMLAFESASCPHYISEKFFRYFESDMILVARGGHDYEKHVPPHTFINTNNFKSTQELAKYLKYLDSHPQEYIEILRRKDEYISLYEDWPIRRNNGVTWYMQYHFEAMGYCEMCRRLWELDKYRKSISDIRPWFERGNCYMPSDLQ